MASLNDDPAFQLKTEYNTVYTYTSGMYLEMLRSSNGVLPEDGIQPSIQLAREEVMQRKDTGMFDMYVRGRAEGKRLYAAGYQTNNVNWLPASDLKPPINRGSAPNEKASQFFSTYAGMYSAAVPSEVVLERNLKLAATETSTEASYLPPEVVSPATKHTCRVEMKNNKILLTPTVVKRVTPEGKEVDLAAGVDARYAHSTSEAQGTEVAVTISRISNAPAIKLTDRQLIGYNLDYESPQERPLNARLLATLDAALKACGFVCSIIIKSSQKKEVTDILNISEGIFTISAKQGLVGYILGDELTAGSEVFQSGVGVKNLFTKKPDLLGKFEQVFWMDAHQSTYTGTTAITINQLIPVLRRKFLAYLSGLKLTAVGGGNYYAYTKSGGNAALNKWSPIKSQEVADYLNFIEDKLRLLYCQVIASPTEKQQVKSLQQAQDKEAYDMYGGSFPESVMPGKFTAQLTESELRPFAEAAVAGAKKKCSSPNCTPTKEAVQRVLGIKVDGTDEVLGGNNGSGENNTPDTLPEFRRMALPHKGQVYAYIKAHGMVPAVTEVTPTPVADKQAAANAPPSCTPPSQSQLAWANKVPPPGSEVTDYSKSPDSTELKEFDYYSDSGNLNKLNNGVTSHGDAMKTASTNLNDPVNQAIMSKSAGDIKREVMGGEPAAEPVPYKAAATTQPLLSGDDVDALAPSTIYEQGSGIVSSPDLSSKQKAKVETLLKAKTWYDKIGAGLVAASAKAKDADSSSALAFVAKHLTTNKSWYDTWVELENISKQKDSPTKTSTCAEILKINELASPVGFKADGTVCRFDDPEATWYSVNPIAAKAGTTTLPDPITQAAVITTDGRLINFTAKSKPGVIGITRLMVDMEAKRTVEERTVKQIDNVFVFIWKLGEIPLTQLFEEINMTDRIQVTVDWSGESMGAVSGTPYATSKTIVLAVNG